MSKALKKVDSGTFAEYIAGLFSKPDKKGPVKIKKLTCSTAT